MTKVMKNENNAIVEKEWEKAYTEYKKECDHSHAPRLRSCTAWVYETPNYYFLRSYNTIIAFMNGLTQGFAIPIAISYGAKEEKNMRKFVAGTMKLTLATTVLVTACVLIAIPNILTALKTPDEIYDISLSYVRIILCGVVFCAIYNMCANTLRAVGDSKTPLYCLIASVIINVLLDL